MLLALRTRIGKIAPFAYESPSEKPEDAMAKGQMRGNKEKKKPKQDKNRKKAPTPRRRSPICTAKRSPARTRTARRTKAYSAHSHASGNPEQRRDSSAELGPRFRGDERMIRFLVMR